MMVWFMVLFMAPSLMPRRGAIEMNVIAMESKTFTDLNYIRLYYYKARIVSVEGELYYVPYGKLEFIGMLGQYDFDYGQAYEVQYMPSRKNMNALNHFIDANKLKI